MFLLFLVLFILIVDIFVITLTKNKNKRYPTTIEELFYTFTQIQLNPIHVIPIEWKRFEKQKFVSSFLSKYPIRYHKLKGYNPAMTMINGKPILMIRYSNFSCEYIYMHQYQVINVYTLFDPETQNEMDIEFEYDDSLNKKCSMGFEDPRIISFQNEYYVFMTNPNTTKCLNKMHLISLSISPDLKNHCRINRKLYSSDFPLQKQEKNWTPFVYPPRDPSYLCFMYTVYPPSAYRIHLDTGECVSMKCCTKKLPPLPFFISGGTPMIYISQWNAYLGIGHIKHHVSSILPFRYKYYSIAYKMSPTEPFELTHLSPLLRFHPSPLIHIEFVTGLELTKNQKNVDISIGWEDCFFGITTISLDSLASLLIPVKK